MMRAQVDVTSKNEGRSFADAAGVPLLIKYDARLRNSKVKGIVQEVNEGVAVGKAYGRMCIRACLHARKSVCFCMRNSVWAALHLSAAC